MKEARSMERKVGSLVGALAPMLAPSSSDAGTGAGTYIRYSMNIELYSLNIHLLSRDKIISLLKSFYSEDTIKSFALSPIFRRNIAPPNIIIRFTIKNSSL